MGTVRIDTCAYSVLCGTFSSMWELSFQVPYVVQKHNGREVRFSVGSY